MQERQNEIMFDDRNKKCQYSDITKQLIFRRNQTGKIKLLGIL